MTLEEIYTHFQVPDDDSSNSIFTTTYTKNARNKIKQILVDKSESKPSGGLSKLTP